MTTSNTHTATAAPAIDAKPTGSRGTRASAAEAVIGSKAAPGSAPSDTLPARVSRTDQLMEALLTPEGASIEDLCTRFSWLPHSARAALTGLRKRGLDVERSKEGSVTVYRITGA
jgi:Protein of unknown function (DUF3489)